MKFPTEWKNKIDVPNHRTWIWIFKLRSLTWQLEPWDQRGCTGCTGSADGQKMGTPTFSQLVTPSRCKASLSKTGATCPIQSRLSGSGWVEGPLQISLRWDLGGFILRLSHCSHGGFQLVMGVPQVRWMVYFMKNPNLEWMTNRGTPILGKLHMTSHDITWHMVVFSFPMPSKNEQNEGRFALQTVGFKSVSTRQLKPATTWFPAPRDRIMTCDRCRPSLIPRVAKGDQPHPPGHLLPENMHVLKDRTFARSHVHGPVLEIVKNADF